MWKRSGRNSLRCVWEPVNFDAPSPQANSITSCLTRLKHQSRLLRFKHTLVGFPRWYAWFGPAWTQQDVDENNWTVSSLKRPSGSAYKPTLVRFVSSLNVFWPWSKPSAASSLEWTSPHSLQRCALSSLLHYYCLGMCSRLLQRRLSAFKGPFFFSGLSLLDVWPKSLLQLWGDANFLLVRFEWRDI